MAGKASRGRGHRRGKAIAAALDLGSTMIKGALLEESGSLRGIVARPAPPLDGTGLIRESDPSAAIVQMLPSWAKASREPSGAQVGASPLVSLRSSLPSGRTRTMSPSSVASDQPLT